MTEECEVSPDGVEDGARHQPPQGGLEEAVRGEAVLVSRLTLDKLANLTVKSANNYHQFFLSGWIF